jgi:hypothetical protein
MALTVAQAEAESRWRWSSLFARGFARHSSGQRLPFEVGTKRFGVVTVRGQGNSWESAFKDAADRTNNPVPKTARA